MRCPFCSCDDTRVIDSRLMGSADQVRRRRQCESCNERFTTYETCELNLPRIIKNDGRREPFSEDKVRVGLTRAVEKRPVETRQIDEIVMHVKRKLRAEGEREVSSQKLGNWLMEQLHGVDDVAYVRFASVYRRFQDVRAFIEEIERLKNELPPEFKENQLDLLSILEHGKSNDDGAP